MRIAIYILQMILIFSHIAHADSDDRDRFRATLDQAVVEQKAGNHRVAVKLFKKVYSKSQNLKDEAFKGIILSLTESKRWDDAIDLLRIEIKKRPFIGDLRVQLADTLFRAERYQDSVTEIGFAENILGPNRTVLLSKSAIQQKLEKHADAVETLSIYLKENLRDYNALLNRGSSYLQLGQFVNAFKDLQKAYEIRPFDEQIISLYVKAAFYSHNYREAKRIGKKCNDLFPTNFICFEYLGKSAFHKKEYSRAALALASAVNLNPQALETRVLLAEALAQNGQIMGSDAHYVAVLKQQPGYEIAMRSWTAFLAQRKNIEVLGTNLKNFCDNAPSSIWGAVELSKLLFFVGASDDAFQEIERISMDDKTGVALFYNAYFLARIEKFEKAKKILMDLAKKNSLPDLEFHLAIVSYKQKKLEEAIQYWLKTPIDSKLRFNAQVNAALAFEQLGNKEKALEILAELNPPTDFKKIIGRKRNSLSSSDERAPAQALTSDISYFLDWSLPPL
jgi:tetratricopeptide (TPR) repeat protein